MSVHDPDPDPAVVERAMQLLVTLTERLLALDLAVMPPDRRAALAISLRMIDSEAEQAADAAEHLDADLATWLRQHRALVQRIEARL